jgi:nitrite reductase (NO-forming)
LAPHLVLLGAVVRTEFTLWPTVLRTRMVAGVERAVRWSLPPMVVGLAAAAAGLLAQRRAVALGG